MKKLQKNYTTPEQSKRLLELGVPAWTADCFFGGYGGHPDYKTIRQTEFEIEDDSLFKLNDHLTPCWSVARLIEIYHICVGPGCSFTFHVCFPNLMNEIMYKLGEANCNGWLDLKKLEE